MYSLTHEELLNITAAGNYKALDIALFSLAVGVLLTSVITLVTVVITDTKIFAAFIALASVTFFGVVFFGIRAALAWRAANRQLRMVEQNGKHS